MASSLNASSDRRVSLGRRDHKSTTEKIMSKINHWLSANLDLIANVLPGIDTSVAERLRP
jgi:hypothetical protein